jgi:hypothetical protein
LLVLIGLLIFEALTTLYMVLLEGVFSAFSSMASACVRAMACRE